MTAGLALRRPPDAPPAAPVDRRRRGATIALAVAVLVVVAGRLWGQHVYWSDPESHIRAAPFFGRWDVEWRWWLLPAVAFAVVLVARGPAWAERLPWRKLLVLAGIGALVWAVALAASEGTSRLSEPLTIDLEYYAGVDDVVAAGPAHFLDTYVDQLPSLPLHARSHPPGMVLVYWALASVGLDGPGWAAAFVLAVAATTVPATLLTLRSVAGETVARRAAPFLVLAPAAVWIASTADGLFAAVIAWTTALVALALGRRGRSAWALALAGGVGAGVALHLTYGATLPLLVPAALAVARRRFDLALPAVAGVGAVTVAFLANGFWWWDGLTAARGYYAESSAAHRPYSYSLVGNLAVLALLLGPAAVAGLGALAASWRRWPGLATFVAATATAVLLADLSGLSKAEVERIWLPFVPGLLAAGAALPRRWWAPALALSGLSGLVLETWLDGPW